jgi:hypothetical protein
MRKSEEMRPMRPMLEENIKIGLRNMRFSYLGIGPSGKFRENDNKTSSFMK